MLRSLHKLNDQRAPGLDYKSYEFSDITPRVRYSLRHDEYKARFPNLETMNRCFHQSNITDYDLRAGKITVVGKFLDFTTRKLQFRTITLSVPTGSTIRTVNVVDLFQQFCDVTNEISAVDGLSDNEDSDESGEEIILEHDDALSHDQRVYTRRHLLNRMLKWITMTSIELLECYSFTGNYR